MNRDELMSKIDQISVWSFILKDNIYPKKSVLNILRGDRRLGSCYLKWGDKDLVMVDYANSFFNGFDCIKAYMYQNPHLSWKEVCDDLLKITGKSEYIVERSKEQKEEVTFDINYTPWTKQNYRFWKEIKVSPWQLDNPQTLTKPFSQYDIYRDGVYSRTIKGNGYAYHSKGRVKCYIPHLDKNKWRTNFNLDDFWYINRGSDTLLLTKSNKCLLVWQKLVSFDLVNYITESALPTEDFVNKVMIHYKNIYSIRDNDFAGLQMAGLTDDEAGRKRKEKQKKLYGSLDVQHKVIPLWCGHKDVADLVREESKQNVLKIINNLFK